ncbi:hypothetical protein AYI70_g2214 [Smittium culicis]|uniref:RNA polymerase-associated protein LEO1 n=2 Tax=Smittium culicis TaxID=133412 RepID=A0A1R1Y9H0_9FUNG|nr:hypothetical protein AYI70_g2214 [Smittium culicis]
MPQNKYDETPPAIKQELFSDTDSAHNPTDDNDKKLHPQFQTSGSLSPILHKLSPNSGNVEQFDHLFGDDDSSNDEPISKNSPLPNNKISSPIQNSDSELFQKDSNLDALFHDNSDIDSAPSTKLTRDFSNSPPPHSPVTKSEFFSDDSMNSDDEVDEIVDREQLKVMEVSLALKPSSISCDKTIVAKLPTGLRIDPHVFDPSDWSDLFKKERDSFLKNFANTGHSQQKIISEWKKHAKTCIQNTLRWSYKSTQDSTSPIPVTNSYFVKWSDDSLTLHISDNPPFIVEPTLLNSRIKNPNFKNLKTPRSKNSHQKDLEQFLAVHHQQEGLLLAQTRVSENWIIRPAQASLVKDLTSSHHAIGPTGGLYHSNSNTEPTDINTASHNSLLPGLSSDTFASKDSLNFNSKINKNIFNKKAAGTKLFVPDVDPEFAARELEKAEEAREKAFRRQENSRRKQEERVLAGLAPKRGDQNNYSDNEYNDDHYLSSEQRYNDNANNYSQRNLDSDQYRSNKQIREYSNPSKYSQKPSKYSNREPRNSYAGENSEDDDFVVDDDEDLEVGSFDEFDREDLEEEEQYRSSKHKSSSLNKHNRINSSPSNIDNNPRHSQSPSHLKSSPHLDSGSESKRYKSEKSHKSYSSSKPQPKRRLLLSSDDDDNDN